jgi:hypothetical protein
LREAHAESLEAVFHFTAALALCEFVRDAQFGRSTIWCVARTRFRFSD